MNVVVMNKITNTKKQVGISYFQTLGHLRQKIAEAFDYQINEFVMHIRNNYVDPDEDDEKYVKDINQFNQVFISKNNLYSNDNHPKKIIANNQVYFEKLFNILSSEEINLIEPVWDLLSRLPINASL